MRKQTRKNIKKNYNKILPSLSDRFFLDDDNFETINFEEHDLELNPLLDIENLPSITTRALSSNTTNSTTKTLDIQESALEKMLVDIEDKESALNKNADKTITPTEAPTTEDNNIDLSFTSDKPQLTNESSSNIFPHYINEENILNDDLPIEELENNSAHTGDELDSIMSDYFNPDDEYEKNIDTTHINNKINKKLDVEELNITITVTANNIFVHGRNLKTGHLVLYTSTGIKHIETSKANLKHNFEYFFLTFFGNNSNFQDPEFFGHYDIISYTIKAPKYMIQTIVDILETHMVTNEDDNFSLRSSMHIIEIPYLKAFNGCKGPKKKRLKRTRSHTLFK